MSAEDELVLKRFQAVSGHVGRVPLTGRLRGADLTLAVGPARYHGRVQDDAIEGTMTIGGVRVPWQAMRRGP